MAKVRVVAAQNQEEVERLIFRRNKGSSRVKVKEGREKTNEDLNENSNGMKG